MDDSSPGPASAFLKALFYLFTLLLLAAVGYAGWVVILYWDRVGV